MAIRIAIVTIWSETSYGEVSRVLRATLSEGVWATRREDSTENVGYSVYGSQTKATKAIINAKVANEGIEI